MFAAGRFPVFSTIRLYRIAMLPPDAVETRAVMIGRYVSSHDRRLNANDSTDNANDSTDTAAARLLIIIGSIGTG